MEERAIHPVRKQKIIVLAYGEGEDEKIFLRHLDNRYCRKDKVTIKTGCASGSGNPAYILDKAIQFRGGVKYEHEFILLDKDNPWSTETIERAEREGVELIGHYPAIESLFLDILGKPGVCKEISATKCKNLFEEHCAGRNFTEDECERLFTKAVLNSARQRIPILDKIIKIMEGPIE